MNELWVRCGNCNHRWVALHLPMEFKKSSEIIKRLICPKCATTSKSIFVCAAPEVTSDRNP